MSVVCLCLWLGASESRCSISKVYKRHVRHPIQDELQAQVKSGPLILTPFIEDGQVELGRNLSKVTELSSVADGVESYSGFLTVNKKYNSNMFFWFFPALVRE